MICILIYSSAPCLKSLPTWIRMLDFFPPESYMSNCGEFAIKSDII